MRRRGRLCEAARRIVEATAPGRGGAAGYTACHALRLLELAAETRIGRPMVERLLDLGEASARSLMRRLREAGLLEARKGGHVATPEAASVLALLDHIKCAKLPPHDSIPWRDPVMVSTDLLEPPSSLVEVYNIRDYIVEEGCRNCIIAGLLEGRIVLPGVEENEIPGLKEHLALAASEELEWTTGVIVVVPWDCRWQACSALLRAFADACKAMEG